MNTVFRNMRLQQKKLARIISSPGIKAVSFDLFDTLLLRACCTPDDIFRLVALECGLSWDFAHIRMHAEQAARKLLPPDQEEVTLDEIYVQVQCSAMLSDAETERIRQTELAVEKRLLQVNTPVLSLYQKVLDSGKKVIICSDMYLPEEFIRQILENLKITGYHRFYLSSTHRASKIAGGLYRMLTDDLRKEGIGPSQILHIGDSYEIDFRQAKRAGIRGFHLPSPRQAAQRFLLEPHRVDADERLCLGNSCLLGTALNLCTVSAEAESAAWFGGLAAACEIAACNTAHCPAPSRIVSELIQAVKDENGLAYHFQSHSKQFNQLIPYAAEILYDVETLWEMLLIRGIFLSDSTFPELHSWKIRHQRILDEKRQAVIRSQRPTIKQIVKAVAWKTGLFPVMSKIYHRLQQTGAREHPSKSELTWLQIRELLQKSLDELEQTAAAVPAGKKTILYLGHIAAFDKGVCGYLNRVAEQMPDHTWLLLSETPKMTPEEIAQKIHFPFLKIPRGPFAGGLDFGIIPEQQDCDSVCACRNSRLAEAADNICAHFPGTERLYADYLVKYFHQYCTRALQLLQPGLIVIWNQFVPFHSIMADVCREQKVPFIFMEFGSFAGTFALDSNGQMGESTAAVNPASVLNIPVSIEEHQLADQICHYLSAAHLNRNAQPRDADQLEKIRHFCKGTRVVVFFGQSDYEAGLYPYSDHARQFHSPVYKSSLQAMQKTAEVCRRHGWKLIYKPHPAMDYNAELAGTPADVLITGDISIFDLFTVADVVVTIASQCSYEALLHQVPVVMLGHNQLKGKHCTYEAFTESALDSALQQAMKQGFTDAQKEAFCRHAAQMFRSCLYDDESQRPVRYGQTRDKFINKLLRETHEV